MMSGTIMVLTTDKNALKVKVMNTSTGDSCLDSILNPKK
jgi:hypothetical protein